MTSSTNIPIPANKITTPIRSTITAPSDDFTMIPIDSSTITPIDRSTITPTVNIVNASTEVFRNIST